MNTTLHSLKLAALLGVILTLGACKKDGGEPRDFNELIPRMMGAIKKQTPEEAATNLFNVTSPDERRDAIAYLQTKPWGHEPPYMHAYELLVTDPVPMVRGQALRALGTSHQDYVVKILNKYLADPDIAVRRDAIYGLCYTFNETSTPSLIILAQNDPDDQVRIDAVYCLRFSHKPEAIHALINCLDDHDSAVVFYGHQSLVSITTRDLGVDSRPWLAWYQKTYIQTPALQPAG